MGVGVSNAEVIRATSLNDGLAKGVPIALSIRERVRKHGVSTKHFGWWPVVRHQWPWGGASDLRVFQWIAARPGGLGDSPETDLYPSAVPSFDVVPDEPPPTWSLNFHLAVSQVRWALEDERRLSRMRSVPSDDEVAHLTWDSPAPAGALRERYIKHHAARMGLELRQPIVQAWAAGLLGIYALCDPISDRVHVIAVPRPSMRTEGGRLHSWDGPAATWEDGTGCWSWRGLPVPSKIVKRQGVVRVTDILSTMNRDGGPPLSWTGSG
jgi:hypothetical protein